MIKEVSTLDEKELRARYSSPYRKHVPIRRRTGRVAGVFETNADFQRQLWNDEYWLQDDSVVAAFASKKETDNHVPDEVAERLAVDMWGRVQWLKEQGVSEQAAVALLNDMFDERPLTMRRDFAAENEAMTQVRTLRMLQERSKRVRGVRDAVLDHQSDMMNAIVNAMGSDEVEEIVSRRRRRRDKMAEKYHRPDVGVTDRDASAQLDDDDDELDLRSQIQRMFTAADRRRDRRQKRLASRGERSLDDMVPSWLTSSGKEMSTFGEDDMIEDTNAVLGPGKEDAEGADGEAEEGAEGGSGGGSGELSDLSSVLENKPPDEAELNMGDAVSANVLQEPEGDGAVTGLLYPLDNMDGGRQRIDFLRSCSPEERLFYLELEVLSDKAPHLYHQLVDDPDFGAIASRLGVRGRVAESDDGEQRSMSEDLERLRRRHGVGPVPDMAPDMDADELVEANSHPSILDKLAPRFDEVVNPSSVRQAATDMGLLKKPEGEDDAELTGPEAEKATLYLAEAVHREALANVRMHDMVDSGLQVVPDEAEETEDLATLVHRSIRGEQQVREFTREDQDLELQMTEHANEEDEDNLYGMESDSDDESGDFHPNDVRLTAQGHRQEMWDRKVLREGLDVLEYIEDLPVKPGFDTMKDVLSKNHSGLNRRWNTPAFQKVSEKHSLERRLWMLRMSKLLVDRDNSPQEPDERQAEIVRMFYLVHRIENDSMTHVGPSEALTELVFQLNEADPHKYSIAYLSRRLMMSRGLVRAIVESKRLELEAMKAGHIPVFHPLSDPEIPTQELFHREVIMRPRPDPEIVDEFELEQREREVQAERLSYVPRRASDLPTQPLPCDEADFQGFVPAQRHRLVCTDTSTSGEDLVVKTRETDGSWRWADAAELTRGIQAEKPFRWDRRASISKRARLTRSQRRALKQGNHRSKEERRMALRHLFSKFPKPSAEQLAASS